MKKAYLLLVLFLLLNFSSKSQQLQIALDLYQSQNYIKAINILEHLEESDKQLFYLSKCYENISFEKSRDLKIYFIQNFKNSIFIDEVHSSLANIQYNSSDYSNCINNYQYNWSALNYCIEYLLRKIEYHQ